MRSCLEHSRGIYVLHVDHDDVLTTDALRVVASSLAQAGWPELFYSDEDKLLGSLHRQPYLKPGWDPALFVNSCYIAHLCGFERGWRSSSTRTPTPTPRPAPTGTRSCVPSSQVSVPHHIPEVLYSWRIHPASTAANPMNKPVAVSTHKHVLGALRRGAGVVRAVLDRVHPDGPERIDWWIRRRAVEGSPLTTVVVGGAPGGAVDAVARIASIDHRVEHVDVDDLAGLRAIAQDAARRVTSCTSSRRPPRPCVTAGTGRRSACSSCTPMSSRSVVP